jgi:hypothetical protein
MFSVHMSKVTKREDMGSLGDLGGQKGDEDEEGEIRVISGNPSVEKLHGVIHLFRTDTVSV